MSSINVHDQNKALEAPPSYQLDPPLSLDENSYTEQVGAAPPPYQATGSCSVHKEKRIPADISPIQLRQTTSSSVPCLWCYLNDLASSEDNFLHAMAPKILIEPGSLFKENRYTQYKAMVNIHFFTKWHKSQHTQWGDNCNHLLEFSKYLFYAHSMLLNSDQIRGTYEDLISMFENTKFESCDPNILEFKELLEREWETMDDLKKGKYVRKWLLDPWEFNKGNEGEHQLIRTLVDRYWKDPSSSVIDDRTRHDAVAQIYLFGKLYSSHRLSKTSPLIETYNSYLQSSLGIPLLSFKEIEKTHHDLCSARGETALQTAKIRFKGRLDALWTNFEIEEKKTWRERWEGQTPEGREAAEERFRKRKGTPKEKTWLDVVLLRWEWNLGGGSGS